jgi:rhamnulokinase
MKHLRCFLAVLALTCCLGALADGRLELRELRRFPNEPVALPTGLYWDTLRLFHEIVSGLRDAGRVAPRLDGVGIDTWGVDFGLLGSDGALIDNPRHYRDPRTCGLAEQIFRVVPRAKFTPRPAFNSWI